MLTVQLTMSTILAKEQDNKTNLPQIHVSSAAVGSSKAPHVILSNKAAIWEDFKMGNVKFSAGNMQDKTDNQGCLEQDISNAGLSGVTNLAVGFFGNILDNISASNNED